MEDDVGGAVNGLEGLFDQMLAGLHQHLNGHVGGNVAAVDQRAKEFIFGLGGRGETHFDLLNADVHQRVEKFDLFLDAHGVDQRLVAVAQVNRTPDGRFLDLLFRPGAVGQVDGDERNILFIGLFHGKVPPYGGVWV